MTTRCNGNMVQAALTEPWHLRLGLTIRQYAVISVMACAFLGPEGVWGQCLEYDPIWGPCSVLAPNTLVVNNDSSANCCDDPPCDGTPAEPYCSIRDAVIDSDEGDTVCVEPGTYTPQSAQLDFRSHNFKLRSTGGRDVTTILGTLRIAGGHGAETLVEGFTITNTAVNKVGIRCDNTHPEIRWNRITGCTSHGIELVYSDACVADNIISWNEDSGISIYKSGPLIIDTEISNNYADSGGGIYIDQRGSSGPVVPTTVTIVRCLIEGNTAEYNGGGVSVFWEGTLRMVNCILRRNEVLGFGYYDNGGGMYVDSVTSLTARGPATSPCEETEGLREIFMQNCLVSCNKANNGGGLYFLNVYAHPEIVNCTFSGNEAYNDGGGIMAWASCVKVHNSILWGNTAPTGPELVATYSADLTVSYSVLQGGCEEIEESTVFPVACTEEPNVLDEDPLFVGPLTCDPPFGPCSYDGGLRIPSGSPAIDAGDNAKVLYDLLALVDDEDDLDLDLNPRFVDDPGTTDTGSGTPPIVDMGAYELQCASSSSPPEQPEAASAKNRYISVTAGDPGRNQAIRVRFVSLPPPFDIWNCLDLFVGEPFEACENSGKGLETAGENCPSALPTDTFWAAPLECHNVSDEQDPPWFMDWHGSCDDDTCVGGVVAGATCDVDDDCQRVIHLYNEGIVPSLADAQGVITDPAVYDIQVVDEDCSLEGESNYSAPLTMTQARWADICGPGLDGACTGAAEGDVDVANDVLGVLDKFANVNILQKTRADIEPGDFVDSNGPDFKVNVANDVLYTLAAFGGASYPFTPDPTGPCPGE